MGKKGTKRKTRWKALPLAGEDAEGSGNESDLLDEDVQSTSSSGRTITQPLVVRMGLSKDRSRHRRYPYDPRGHNEPLVKLESKTFDDEEYTKVTTPRQDVLFKKKYFGRKKTESSMDENQVNEETKCEEGPMEQIIITNGFVDERGHYLVNGSSYEIYDPYTNTVTVVVGPPPYAANGVTPPVLAAVSCQPVPLQPVEWYPTSATGDWTPPGPAWTPAYPPVPPPDDESSCPPENVEPDPTNPPVFTHPFLFPATNGLIYPPAFTNGIPLPEVEEHLPEEEEEQQEPPKASTKLQPNGIEFVPRQYQEQIKTKESHSTQTVTKESHSTQTVEPDPPKLSKRPTVQINSKKIPESPKKTYAKTVTNGVEVKESPLRSAEKKELVNGDQFITVDNRRRQNGYARGKQCRKENIRVENGKREDDKSSTISELSSPTDLSSGQNTPCERKKSDERNIVTEISRSEKLKEIQQNEQQIEASESKKSKKKKPKPAPPVELNEQKTVPPSKPKQKKKKRPELPKEPLRPDIPEEEEPQTLPEFLQLPKDELDGFDLALDHIENTFLRSLRVSEERIAKIRLNPQMMPILRPKLKLEDYFLGDFFAKSNLRLTKPEEVFATVIETSPVQKKKTEEVKEEKKVEKQEQEESRLGIVEAVTTWLQSQKEPEKVLKSENTDLPKNAQSNPLHASSADFPACSRVAPMLTDPRISVDKYYTLGAVEEGSETSSSEAFDALEYKFDSTMNSVNSPDSGVQSDFDVDSDSGTFPKDLACKLQ